MRVAKMPYLQVVKGKYRVRMVVPPELRPIIGQANLTKWLGTGNEPEANRLSVPWIAKFSESGQNAIARVDPATRAVAAKVCEPQKPSGQVCVHFGAHFCSAPRILGCLQSLSEFV
jgi:hypothetical protein